MGALGIGMSMGGGATKGKEKSTHYHRDPETDYEVIYQGVNRRNLSHEFSRAKK